MIMALLQWKDHYSVGAAAIDDEHKELIERINRLYEQLMAEMSRLWLRHFRRSDQGYHSAFRPGRAVHASEHDQLPQHREDFERMIDEVPSPIANSIAMWKRAARRWRRGSTAGFHAISRRTMHACTNSLGPIQVERRLPRRRRLLKGTAWI
jgi:hemerythrin